MVRLTRGLDTTLAQPGLPSGKIALRGSAVTEHKFDKATNRYSGPRMTAPSDYDIAIVSSELLEIARKKGVKIMPNGRRTIALDRQKLEKLGLAEPLKKLAARLTIPRVTVMVYRDEESLNRRGAMVWLKQ